MHEAHLAGGPLERYSDEHCVVRIVFHKHDRDALCKHFVHAFSHAARTSMLNVLPLPGADCTRILPPIFDTPRSTIASPIPVPGYCSIECSRSNARKICSWCTWSIPMPSSRT